MTIQLTWLHEPYVLLERFYDRVTLHDISEMKAAVDRILSHTASHSTHRIHAIIDVTEVTDYPANLARLKAIITPSSVERGWLILIVPEGNLLLHFVSAFAAQLRMPTKFRAFYSYAEALDFLNTQEPALMLSARCPCARGLN